MSDEKKAVVNADKYTPPALPRKPVIGDRVIYFTPDIGPEPRHAKVAADVITVHGDGRLVDVKLIGDGVKAYTAREALYVPADELAKKARSNTWHFPAATQTEPAK